MVRDPRRIFQRPPMEILNGTVVDLLYHTSVSPDLLDASGRRMVIPSIRTRSVALPLLLSYIGG